RAAIDDPLPLEFKQRHNLSGLSESLIYLHQPPDDADVAELVNGKTAAHRRLVFEELFFLELGLALKRQGVVRERGVAIHMPDDARREQVGALPFNLTGAQVRVLASVYRDMAEPHPMNRLIQGDVGSGKTVISLLAARAAVHSGYQVAVMAPTEILAEQHFNNFRVLMGSDASQVGLLTASLTEKDKKWMRACLRDGRMPIVVGTHALLSDNVIFNRLGLVVIDEQHRFGVMQRKTLRAKASADGVPDILVMTATPIPRTLAMTIYGELDVSVIDELPPGRHPIATRVITEAKRHQLYNTLRSIAERGEQIYIVYPLVEETEKSDLKAATEMARHLQSDIFPNLKVGLLHGRMSGDEK
ncbi:MAG: DEAD/DEAH box helicase, partial [Saprospiraceae bacterium]|nr:DEAD/DEAH box helicase [Saprospiraceae bacterium]